MDKTLEKLRDTPDPRDKLRLLKEYASYPDPRPSRQLLGTAQGVLYLKATKGYLRDEKAFMVFKVEHDNDKTVLTNDTGAVQIMIHSNCVITHTVLDVTMSEEDRKRLGFGKKFYRIEHPLSGGPIDATAGSTITIERPDPGWIHVVVS